MVNRLVIPTLIKLVKSHLYLMFMIPPQLKNDFVLRDSEELADFLGVKREAAIVVVASRANWTSGVDPVDQVQRIWKPGLVLYE